MLVRLSSDDRDKLMDSSTFPTDWDTAAIGQVSAPSLLRGWMDIPPCLVPNTMVRFSRTSSLGANSMASSNRDNQIELKVVSAIYMVSSEFSSAQSIKTEATFRSAICWHFAIG